MVKRIIRDSDFESEDEQILNSAATLPSEGTSNSNGLISTPEKPATDGSGLPLEPPRSVRRVVRRNLPAQDNSYLYDSDIYTEESSIGSFIVHTDDEFESPPEQDGSGTSLNSFTHIRC